MDSEGRRATGDGREKSKGSLNSLARVRGANNPISRPFLHRLLLSSFLLACLLQLFSACNKKASSGGDPGTEAGRALFMAHCIACHNANPALDGSLGPAIKGSSLELVQARVLRGEYPPGYTPKRATKIMVKLPLTEEDVGKIHKFLNAP